jgi:hypothetical protein
MQGDGMISSGRVETRNGRTLSSKHPARLLVLPKIRLGADEDERRVFAEMCHFRVPLKRGEILAVDERKARHTLSWTLASDVGKSMLKTMRMTSLSG